MSITMDNSNDLYTINIELENNFNDEQYRLFSFGPWFNNEVDKEILARAGFFYLTERDFVKCYFCEVSIGYWLRGDNPFIEHKTHSPKCRFINGIPTNNIPIPETQHLLLEELEALKQNNIMVSAASNRSTILVKLSAEHITKNARHPVYADKNERLKSFVNWPASLKQTPEELTDAGFFYLGVGDEVKCFYCGGCLRNFSSNDYALNEHRKYYSTRCVFIQFMYKHLKSSANKLENRRPIKATADQIKYLIDYMDQNETLIFGNLISNRDAYVKAWKDLTKTLNNFDGATKDVKGWREVWRNYKYNLKRKSKLINNQEMPNSIPRSVISCIEAPENEMLAVSMESTSTEPLLDDRNLESESSSNIVANGSLSILQPTMDSMVSNPKPAYEKSNKSNDIEILKIRLKKLELEVEQVRMELEMKIRQQEFDVKRQTLQNKLQEMEKNHCVM